MSVWGVKKDTARGDLKAVSPKQEIVKLYERLTEHDKRALLHGFAERFWGEFMFHQKH